MKHTGLILGLTALFALTGLTACIPTDNTLGSALVSTNQDITLRTATLDLPVGEVRTTLDLQSRISSSVMVGSIGTEFCSEGLMAVSAASDSVTWGANPTVRRVYLSMALDTTMVMQEDQRYVPQNLYVHRLNFELDSTMYNGTIERFQTPYYDPEPISVGGCVYTGDEAWSVDLKKEVGEALLRLPMEVRDSANLFMKQFYGFCLRTDSPDKGLPGQEKEGRLNVFDLSMSYLILTWDYTDDDGFRKTATTYFELGAYHSLNVYRTLESTPDARDAIHVQGLTGGKPYVNALRLKETLTDWAARENVDLDNVLIAKATVEFPFEYSGDRTQFDFCATGLFPCNRLMLDDVPYYAPISEINETELEDGTIDRSLLCYKSNISLYLQDLICSEDSEIDSEDDLWFMPVYSYYNSNTGVTYYYADNFYYSQTRLNGTSDLRHPVLRLTYTQLK